MNKKLIIIPVVIIIGIFLVSFSLEDSGEKSNVIFHVTLADPDLYIEGVYSETFEIDSGEYSFRFVPNGSSPKILSISLSGEKIDFSEDFRLQGTSHETGISQYFTWEYIGQKEILISENQQITISINPNGNVIGSVSVDILQN
ncbi:hypothetical protein NKOR_09725 [Candidatus Nitrosopumilus koreensis AR1]|uniref:Uncharacterized protein n=1 Tax=Candidatus Nitrosopumilus koreensis AR1 TaxID=1229908 RepID=K0B9Y4_9ARCH|nr:MULTISPECIES: hypothetical protein [Nitrosopumilus]AFS81790.1 hypothetical protein NKOR_09725 [Candidatus Nitrosopumilus koreensis AR1]